MFARLFAVTLATSVLASLAQAQDTVPVTVENFVRAESHLYMSAVALKEGGFGTPEFRRNLSPIDDQTVVRQNRDTLYAAAVFDLDAGPTTITLPAAGDRFISMQTINEDMYSPPAVYDSAPHTLTREEIGSRYVLAAFRILVDPSKPGDLGEARVLQDAIKISQPGGPGTFEVPNWDPVSQSKIRDALLVLGETVTDTSKAFGTKDEVDPVLHLISAATTWGGNPPKDAVYLTVTPSKNDGKQAYRLNVKDVPIDGFWSVIVYDEKGYIPKNDRDVYSFNNLTATKDADGSVTIQFGGGENDAPNVIPIVPGWSYTVRLYRPHAEILDGTWKFPEAVPVGT